MASISNIKSVRSVSREGMSVVILEFGENANMDSIVIEMRENLDMIKAYMPDNAGAPIIMKLNPDMLPLMVLSAAVKGQSIGESSSFLESRIIPELESIEGVASVSAAGLVDNQIHVILREEKIKEVNDKVKQAVQEAMQQARNGIQAAASALKCRHRDSHSHRTRKHLNHSRYNRYSNWRSGKRSKHNRCRKCSRYLVSQLQESQAANGKYNNCSKHKECGCLK